MSPQFEIALIAVLIAAACALPGTFLVLRKMSMMSDSITHTILLGIVLAFFVTHNLSSPLLILGAAAMGVVTVWLTELLGKTRLVSEDSAIGLVFPLLFSIAIILISRYAGSVHLDADSVLLGELAFAPFDRLAIGGVDVGAKAIWLSGGLLALNLLVIGLFYKEFKLATFDPMLAAVLGFSPVLLHYGLMALVSVTAVGAFQSVGSILVVAFMIAPPATAYLLTDNLTVMLGLGCGIGAGCGLAGYGIASILDVSIAGSMAVMCGIVFAAALIFAPSRGLVPIWRQKRRQKTRFAKQAMLIHLYHHAGNTDETWEMGVDSIQYHMHWSSAFTNKVLSSLIYDGDVWIDGKTIRLTKHGQTFGQALAKEYLAEAGT